MKENHRKSGAPGIRHGIQAVGVGIGLFIISTPSCVAMGYDLGEGAEERAVGDPRPGSVVTDKPRELCPVSGEHSQSSSIGGLDYLEIVGVGLSLDTMRQEGVLKKMIQQNSEQSNALLLGSMLENDPKKYPSNSDDKNAAWRKRESDALEFALRRFPEAWPLPTITVVGSGSPQTKSPELTVEQTRFMADSMIDGLRQPAGLHWHKVMDLPAGRISSDTPECQIEEVFRRFDANPDMPAVLVYAVSGWDMAAALSSRDDKLGVGKRIGSGGLREPGEFTDAVVAIIFARRERMDWLRPFAKYTKVNGAPHHPGFSGWKQRPKHVFRPTTFILEPWTRRGMEEWDQMKVLARIHRPVTVPLLDLTKPAGRLRRDDVSTALAMGWQQATMEIMPKPSRVFFDGGKARQPLADITSALAVTGSRIDLRDSNESFDLMIRLGDTGAASPFVGIALATMASYTNADTSVVMPMRREDQATVFTITSATPGKPPMNNIFGLKRLLRAARRSPSTAIISPSGAKEGVARRVGASVNPPSEDIEAATGVLDSYASDGPEQPEAS